MNWSFASSFIPNSTWAGSSCSFWHFSWHVPLALHIVKFQTARGANATVGQFPYQASLRIKESKIHVCARSIISIRFILTAAQCVFYYTGLTHNIEAIVGTLHLNQGIVMEISKITPHEKFNQPILQFDISLLRTKEEIVFTSTVQPIALPVHQTDGNTDVIESGWGNSRVNYVSQ